MSQIKLSIVIPVYNAEGYIDRCLGSIINGLDMNTLSMLEIIAVDDGSDDRSYDVILRYKSVFPQLRVLRQENQGAAGARATGARSAAGDYIWFVDPDDNVSEDAVSIILKTIEKEDKSADIFIFDATEIKNGKSRPWEHFDEDAVFDEPEEIKKLQRGILYNREIGSNTPFAAPWDKVYDRRFLNDNAIVFRKELRVLDDMVFNMEAFGAADRVVYIKHPIYNYVRNANGITASYTPGRAGKDMAVWKTIEKYIGSLKSDSRYSKEDIIKLENAFHKRVLKSYGICCKLDIFNIKRHTPIGKRIAYATKLARNVHYRNSFKVHFYEIEPLMWPVLVFGKIANCSR